MNDAQAEAFTKMITGQSAVLSTIASILVDKGVISAEEIRSNFQRTSDDISSKTDGGIIAARMVDHVLNAALVDGKNLRKDQPDH